VSVPALSPGVASASSTADIDTPFRQKIERAHDQYRLAREVLLQFGVSNAFLALQRHHHNLTFSVEARRERFLLRIGPAEYQSAAMTSSETAWLAALRRDTPLAVPEPLRASNDLFVVAAVPAIDRLAARCAVLLRWQRGRFYDAQLDPKHLQLVGGLQAQLQRHAATWSRPPGFRRARVDTLTGTARRASIGASSALWTKDDAASDHESAVMLVETALGAASAQALAHALQLVRNTVLALEALPGGMGLIHADLRHDNFLIRSGTPAAIDFDRCGWGPRLYDLAATLATLRRRKDFAALRDGLLHGYSAQAQLPADYDHHLDNLVLLCEVQNLLKAIESRPESASDAWRATVSLRMDQVSSTLRVLG
jgi:Ser/Thr protein kinase RdoA (MazF antagonist)